MSSVESSLNQTLATSTEAQQTPRVGAVVVDEPTHWLLRVEDGTHFIKSQPLMRWGVNTKHKMWVPNFLRTIKPGDILWFVRNNSKGKVLGVATFKYHCKRELGPLVAVTPTNEELGWTQTHGDWDTEIHYTDLYDVSNCNILTEIKSPLVGRVFNAEKCAVNLPAAYPYLVIFSAARRIA